MSAKCLGLFLGLSREPGTLTALSCLVSLVDECDLDGVGKTDVWRLECRQGSLHVRRLCFFNAVVLHRLESCSCVEQPLLLNAKTSRCDPQLDTNESEQGMTLGGACRVSRAARMGECMGTKAPRAAPKRWSSQASTNDSARERVQVGRMQNMRRQARQQASLRLRWMPANTEVEKPSAESPGCENQAPT